MFGGWWGWPLGEGTRPQARAGTHRGRGLGAQVGQAGQVSCLTQVTGHTHCPTWEGENGKKGVIQRPTTTNGIRRLAAKEGWAQVVSKAAHTTCLSGHSPQGHTQLLGHAANNSHVWGRNKLPINQRVLECPRTHYSLPCILAGWGLLGGTMAGKAGCRQGRQAQLGKGMGQRPTTTWHRTVPPTPQSSPPSCPCPCPVLSLGSWVGGRRHVG